MLGVVWEEFMDSVKLLNSAPFPYQREINPEGI
jgi:hypothetical protein